MGDEEALIQGMCAAPDDDLPRLVYADWVDEHGRDTTRWRQWIALRRKIRESLESHTGEDNTLRVSGIMRGIPEWPQRCYAADIGCLIGEKWPINWDEIQHKDAMKWKSTTEHTRMIAELYACGLVIEDQLTKARSSANSAAMAASSASEWEAYSSVWSAAWSAANSADSAMYWAAPSANSAVYWAASPAAMAARSEVRSMAYSLANRYAEIFATFARTL